MTLSMTPTFTLNDGSLYTPYEVWWEAAELRGIVGESVARFIDWFPPYVQGYWDKKMKRTKFGDEPWEGNEFSNQATLAENLFYQEFRAAILGLALANEGKKTGQKAPYVIGINRDGTVTKFSDKPAEQMNMDDWLGEKKDKETHERAKETRENI